MMAQFKSYSPDVEVLGESVQAFIEGFPAGLADVGKQILGKHGINNAEPGKYYPLQSWLDAMKEVADTMGTSILRRIGEEIANNAKLPPGLDTLEQFLEVIDQAYQMNYKGGEIGHYDYSYEGENSGLKRGKLVISSPFPCAYDWGVLEGFATRLKPSGSDVVVSQDETQPKRSEGADSSTYLVSWG
jgi:hypothetical protein